MQNSTNLENFELRSEEINDVLTRAPHWMIRWGNGVFLTIISIILVMSYLIKYPDVIVSQAIITTRVPPQKEYAKTTGKLETILVKDNEIVKKDQPLAVIENTAIFEDVLFLKRIIDTLDFNNRNFIFPLENIPVLFLGEIDPDYAFFENSYLQYKFNKDFKPFSNEALANHLSIVELNNRLKNLNSQKELYQSELSIKEKDLGRNEILFDKGVISARDFENKQSEYLQAERNFSTLGASISQLREAISNAQKTSRSTEINSKKENITLLKNVIQSFNQLKKSISEWEMQYLLQSHIDGKVSFLDFWAEKQTVNQGDLIFTIIPNDSSNFVARLKTPPQNSGKIKIGQKVNIKLNNYPDTEFGAISGVVHTISIVPDTKGLYHVEVNLPSKLITSYNQEIEFKQEMGGIAEIITEDLRLIERILYQFKDIISL